MIRYREHKLENGLEVIVHEDKSTPLCVVNLMYKVGSRNEHRNKTGFAHLFEHLMFGGSRNVPHFDKVLNRAGAENNAFTNTDVTNYYIILSARNLETALWVESDRMANLLLDQKKLDMQKNVVVEEFKQRYLNVPYGDVWLKLRPLAYQTHPYRWPTIGRTPEHISEAKIEDVQHFHQQYYAPNNAVLTIAGNVEDRKAFELVEKWFGDLTSHDQSRFVIEEEPTQVAPRITEVRANVPMDAIYKAYHMPPRGCREYVVADLLSDMLGRGKSSRLHQDLVRDQKVFNSINAYITGSADPGLLVISGKLNPGKDLKNAEQLIVKQIENLKRSVGEDEVEKVINQALSSAYFAATELLNRAIALSLAKTLGDTDLVNRELEWIKCVSKSDILEMADKILKEDNCTTLF
jgi:zinc protease